MFKVNLLQENRDIRCDRVYAPLATPARPLYTASLGRPPERTKTISDAFTPEERTRFLNLLKLAADSPFAGERDNALAAAERLAARNGMTLDEAAAGGRRQRPRQKEDFSGYDGFAGAAGFGNGKRAPTWMDVIDHRIYLEKARREKAMQAAFARGLDADERRAKDRPYAAPSRSRRRRDPWSHARALLSETSLPLSEVVDITGLDIYQVAGLKLKMRGSG